MFELSELQLGLLVSGAALIFGVLLLNKIESWRVRKNRPIGTVPLEKKRAEPMLKSNSAAQDTDVLLSAMNGLDADSVQEADFLSRIDVSLAVTSPAMINSIVDSSPTLSAVLAPTELSNVISDEQDIEVIESLDAHLLSHPISFVAMDPLIDCVVAVPLAHPTSSERILPLLSRLRFAGSKPVYCEGLNVSLQQREPVCAGQRYDHLWLAVQLVNRSGALRALEFSEFASGVQQLAQNLEGTAALPDMASILAQANNLDTFAQANDVQLHIHVQSAKQTWLASYVQNLVQQAGLILSRDGSCFIYCQSVEQTQSPVFTLRFHDINFLRDDVSLRSGNQINLRFDVACAQESTRPFRLMWSYAQHLAQQLHAQVVDDRGDALSQSILTTIENQLRIIYVRLHERGLVAGSPTALRLFSE